MLAPASGKQGSIQPHSAFLPLVLIPPHRAVANAVPPPGPRVILSPTFPVSYPGSCSPPPPPLLRGPRLYPVYTLFIPCLYPDYTPFIPRLYPVYTHLHPSPHCTPAERRLHHFPPWIFLYINTHFLFSTRPAVYFHSLHLYVPCMQMTQHVCDFFLSLFLH